MEDDSPGASTDDCRHTTRVSLLKMLILKNEICTEYEKITNQKKLVFTKGKNLYNQKDKIEVDIQ